MLPGDVENEWVIPILSIFYGVFLFRFRKKLIRGQIAIGFAQNQCLGLVLDFSLCGHKKTTASLRWPY